jgi:hypothetical protein
MFRFTIRELVLLTLVVAMGVGWWLDHTRQHRVSREIAASFDRAVRHLSAEHQADLERFIANWERSRSVVGPSASSP